MVGWKEIADLSVQDLIWSDIKVIEKSFFISKDKHMCLFRYLHYYYSVNSY